MRNKIIAAILTIAVTLGCFGGFSGYAADTEMSFDKAYGMLENMANYLCTQTPTDRDYLYDWVHSYMKTDLGVDSLIKLVDDQTAVGGNTTILNYIFSFGTTEAEKNDLKFALAMSKTIPTDARAQAFDDMKARKEFALDMSDEESTALDAVYNDFLTDEMIEMLNHDEHKLNKMVIMQFLADFNKTFVLTDGLDKKADFALYKLNGEFKSKIENGELKAKYDTVNGTDWQNAEELISLFVNSANVSAKFDDEMKQNFKSVLGIDGVDMYVKREFDVKVTGKTSQTAGSTSDITLEAVSNIDTDDLTKVEWYVDGVKVATGKDFVYNPSELNAGESAVIKAVLGAYEKDTVVKVTSDIEDYSTDMNGKANQTTDNTTPVNFTINCSDDTVDLSGVKWYVNGVYQNVNGKDFMFRPSSVGTFTITAELEDGTIIEAGTVKVTATASRPSSGSTGRPSGSGSDDIDEPIQIDDPFNKFTDVKDHWAAPYMKKMFDRGIMIGTSETTMSPDWGITRQEVAVLLVRMLGFENETSLGTVKYTDADQIADWAVNAVNILSDKGIYVGYGDGSFQPERIISRQELASVIGRHLSANYAGKMSYVDKNDIYYWAKDHVEMLTALGIVQGFEDNSFRPVENVTRAQAAVMFYKTMLSLGIY